MIGTMTRAMARCFGEVQAIEKLAQAGFDGIDYSMHLYGLGDPVYTQSLRQVRARYAELKQTLDQNGMAVFQVHAEYPTYTGQSKKDEDIFQAVVRGIHVTQALGSPFVVIHPMLPASSTAGAHRNEVWERNRRFYTRLLPYLIECGVQLGIENMFSYEAGRYVPNAVSTGEDMVEYIDRMNDIAGTQCFVACLDTGHAHLLGLDPAQMARELGPRLRLLHVHDNRQETDRHTLPFLGSIDWDRWLDALGDIGYPGAVSFEADGFLSAFPPELLPQAVEMMARVGRYFVRKMKRKDASQIRI